MQPFRLFGGVHLQCGNFVSSGKLFSSVIVALVSATSWDDIKSLTLALRLAIVMRLHGCDSYVFILIREITDLLDLCE